jgi:hypothetical protein
MQERDERDFFIVYFVIYFTLIMEIRPLCPKELNLFITWKIMKIGDRAIKD